MVVLVIHHRSNLAAYLAAIAATLYYRHWRSFRIVVVENNNVTPTATATPWCGTNTVSDLRLGHHDFVVSYLLRTVLIGDADTGIVPLGSVNLAPLAANGYGAVDGPVPTQSVYVRVAAGSEVPVGMLYHPIVVINRLREVLAPAVTFVSLKLTHSLRQLVAQMVPEDQAVVLDFTANSPISTLRNFGYLMSSNLVGVHHTGGQSMPPSALWLPQFKARVGVAPRNLWRARRGPSINNRHTCIDIEPEKQDLIETELISQLDLNYCLRVCDTTLDILEGLVMRGEIRVLSNKL
ncbi:uncharacterized protein CANTADRAFT_22699 [Suhomyces tanzawaensis NRRL Y-17324]|uniref:Uncharacterized protein n=1 Tax=Suhomyces tanzawaensis NRRL Y-17324 TaxID=984487 RepID=A0A1E4SGX1_9ASCO|nr:uncharacterized protein CANTADRAFT_22699 [Suhomyces tanzawaensis NRRL Y-17324]ODV78736.1 hypothetical protein CANTADRAFT_22699 [Suhomyces tanzawaensis NRRL Y-17324]